MKWERPPLAIVLLSIAATWIAPEECDPLLMGLAALALLWWAVVAFGRRP